MIYLTGYNAEIDPLLSFNQSLFGTDLFSSFLWVAELELCSPCEDDKKSCFESTIIRCARFLTTLFLSAAFFLFTRKKAWRKSRRGWLLLGFPALIPARGAPRSPLPCIRHWVWNLPYKWSIVQYHNKY